MYDNKARMYTLVKGDGVKEVPIEKSETDQEIHMRSLAMKLNMNIIVLILLFKLLILIIVSQTLAMLQPRLTPLT